MPTTAYSIAPHTCDLVHINSSQIIVSRLAYGKPLLLSGDCHHSNTSNLKATLANVHYGFCFQAPTLKGAVKNSPISMMLNYPNLTLVDYTKYDISCQQFLLSCSILIVNRAIVSPTLNLNPTLFGISLLTFGEIYSVINTITYQVFFHPNFNHP